MSESQNREYKQCWRDEYQKIYWNKEFKNIASGKNIV